MSLNVPSMPIVREIMTTPPVTLKMDMTLLDATTVLAKNVISGAPVVDDKDHIIGILSEHDVLTYALEKEGLGLCAPTLLFTALPFERMMRDEDLCRRYMSIGDSLVEDVMNEEVVTIDPEQTIEEALETMIRFGFNRLPVVKDGHLMGMVARQDILWSLCREDIRGQKERRAPMIISGTYF